MARTIDHGSDRPAYRQIADHLAMEFQDHTAGGGEMADDNRFIAPCPSIEIADSEGSDDELSFL